MERPIILLSSGHVLVWDATCYDTMAASNIHTAVSELIKYSDLDSAYFFVPVAVETCRAFGLLVNISTCNF